jgi:2-amino-4-hydroxy-6-hydroxymethyldihydropteridine diphosphokinase
MERGVVVALGSNVGNRIEEIEKACRAIDADPDMRIVDTSFLYETKPMYVEDQERFLNGACEVSDEITTISAILQRGFSTLTNRRSRLHSAQWNCWIDCKPSNKAMGESN